MKEIIIWNTSIELQFNEPVAETGYIKESFDITKRHSYATIWISQLLNTKSEIQTQFIVGQIFQEYYRIGKIQELDYLQKLTINWTEVWLIDDWASTICLLTKSEY